MALVVNPSVERVSSELQPQKSLDQQLSQNDAKSQNHDHDVSVEVRESRTEAALQDNLANTWKAGRSQWLIIIVIAIVSLMVALDATILVPVLPVSHTDIHGAHVARLMLLDHCERSPWERDRHLLGRNCLPSHSVGLSTFPSISFGYLWPSLVILGLSRLFHLGLFDLLPFPEFPSAASWSFDPGNWRGRDYSFGLSDYNGYNTASPAAYLSRCQPDGLGFRHNLWTVDRRSTGPGNVAMDILS